MISLAENQSCHRSKTSSCLSAPLTHSRSHSHHLLALSSPSLSSLLPVKAHNVTPSAADERNQPTTSRGTTMTTEKTVALNHERNGDGRFPLCPMNDALFAFAIASYQFRRNERRRGRVPLGPLLRICSSSLLFVNRVIPLICAQLLPWLGRLASTHPVLSGNVCLGSGQLTIKLPQK